MVADMNVIQEELERTREENAKLIKDNKTLEDHVIKLRKEAVEQKQLSSQRLNNALDHVRKKRAEIRRLKASQNIAPDDVSLKVGLRPYSSHCTFMETPLGMLSLFKPLPASDKSTNQANKQASKPASQPASQPARPPARPPAASPSQGYPQHQVRRYPFIHLGRERHCESKVSCPRTQHNVPGQGSNLDRSIRRRAH